MKLRIRYVIVLVLAVAGLGLGASATPASAGCSGDICWPCPDPDSKLWDKLGINCLH